MIRLRQSLDAGLRHPLLGPALVVFLALVLAFAALHAVEHGVEGLLLSCAAVAAVALRMLVAPSGTREISAEPERTPRRRRLQPRLLARRGPAMQAAVRVPLRL